MRALFERKWGTPPGPIDEDIRGAVARTAGPGSGEFRMPALEELREQAEGLASSDEELLLLGLFGEEAERLLRAIRGRADGVENLETAFERARAERIREVVRIVQETGVGEVTIEEDGMRVSVRHTAETAPAPAAAPAPSAAIPAIEAPAEQNGLVAVESPMIGVFYRAPEPGAPPFVEVGDPVAAGQTLCLLEAMKLFNELKSESAGVVRVIHVENGEPVEFGQVLFELEPLVAAPLDAL
jgi:oxaloacetate decarboxylase alpha subunit